MAHADGGDTIVIPEQFCGPPNSGNGGYVAGLLSRWLHGQAPSSEQATEVTLRAPVPLGQPLSLERSDRSARLLRGDTLIAEANPATLQLDVPEPVSWEQALEARSERALAAASYNPLAPGSVRLFHRICFCCSSDLPPDKALQVHCCEVAGADQVAAPWSCDPVFAAQDGSLPPEIVWTALDCPGQMAWFARGFRSGSLLGRMTARQLRPLRAGERNLIIGWTLGSEGRKFHSGTALFNSERELCAYARAIWIGRAVR